MDSLPAVEERKVYIKPGFVLESELDIKGQTLTGVNPGTGLGDPGKLLFP